MTLKILHNPRCSKSREALALLESRGLTPEVVEYLETPLTLPELQTLHQQLGTPVRAMVRDNEDDYRELDLADTSLTDTQLLQAVADRPKLLQRAIVVQGERALIARPPELLNDWLK
ncbi:arsenate reductase (glutaredoxin) [Roseateles chitinivorans]|uniref:arsenate reductase (glutaredoxin) n=1 Tax=Roseateles chitinivorans TaxID=2917965 RepID=UPI003D6667DF